MLSFASYPTLTVKIYPILHVASYPMLSISNYPMLLQNNPLLTLYKYPILSDASYPILTIPYVAITKYPIQPKLWALNVWAILDIKWGFLMKEQNICNKYNQHAINYLKASQLPP